MIGPHESAVSRSPLTGVPELTGEEAISREFRKGPGDRGAFCRFHYITGVLKQGELDKGMRVQVIRLSSIRLSPRRLFVIRFPVEMTEASGASALRDR